MGSQLTLGEVAAIVMGQSPEGITCNRSGVGIPLLNGPTEFGPHHPEATQFTNDPRKLSETGDLLFCVRGSTTGRMNWGDQPYAIGRGIAAIRHRRNSASQHLIRAVLEYNLPQILRAATGSTFPNVSASQLASVPYPSLTPDQEIQISSVLGALDDKIELNRQMKETLEAIARAIFKDWFVDFGPTRAKMEGRAPYLAREVWELFPDRLDDDGMPQGWDVVSLGKVTSELRRGVTPTYKTNGGVCVLNQKCVRDHTINFQLSKRHDDVVRSISGRELSVGDVLINSTGVGTLGRIAQLWHLPEPAIVDTHITVVRANRSVTSPEFLGAYLLFREADIEAMGEGSTGQTELSRETLARLPVLNPTFDAHAAFSSTARSLQAKMTANQIESQTLAQTRDLLLPKLMSGEIRVKDAKMAIGEQLEF